MNFLKCVTTENCGKTKSHKLFCCCPANRHREHLRLQPHRNSTRLLDPRTRNVNRTPFERQPRPRRRSSMDLDTLRGWHQKSHGLYDRQEKSKLGLSPRGCP